MGVEYQDGQVLFQDEKVSIPLAILVLILEVAIFIKGYADGLDLNYLLVGFFILVVYSQFFSLRIIVTRDELIVSYGFGLVQQIYATSALENIRADDNKYLLSWLYDSFGKEVVSAGVRMGKRIYLPTDNTAKLLAALRAR
jgi:hypothetical protein